MREVSPGEGCVEESEWHEEDTIVINSVLAPVLFTLADLVPILMAIAPLSMVRLRCMWIAHPYELVVSCLTVAENSICVTIYQAVSIRVSVVATLSVHLDEVFLVVMIFDLIPDSVSVI